jgi:hypothetical protein
MITIHLQPILAVEYGKPVTITDIRIQATNSSGSALVTLQLQIVPEGEASSVAWVEIRR